EDGIRDFHVTGVQTCALPIFEDEPDILEVLSYNLKREGYEVTTAMDGTRGLSLIRQQEPDLVLLDLMLPGMDGVEVCSSIKKDRSEERRVGKAWRSGWSPWPW